MGLARFSVVTKSKALRHLLMPSRIQWYLLLEIQDQVSSIVNSGYSLTPLTSGPSSYPDSDGVRQMREMWIGWGDDRFGAGYHYLGEAGHDSVRMYNNMIANWERMLAKNELEKLNARAFIMNNINSFDDVSEVSTWLEDLSTGFAANGFDLGPDNILTGEIQTLSDLDLPTFAQTSVWSEADFQPEFVFVSGGVDVSGALTRTQAGMRERNSFVSVEIENTLGYNFKLNSSEVGFGTVVGNHQDIGFSQSASTETSVTYEYTIADDDGEDYMLLAIVPGEDLNGPVLCH